MHDSLANQVQHPHRQVVDHSEGSSAAKFAYFLDFFPQRFIAELLHEVIIEAGLKNGNQLDDIGRADGAHGHELAPERILEVGIAID